MGNKYNRSRKRKARSRDNSKAIAQLALNREARRVEKTKSQDVNKDKPEPHKAAEKRKKEVPLELQAKAAKLTVGRLKASIRKQAHIQNKLKCFKGRRRVAANPEPDRSRPSDQSAALANASLEATAMIPPESVFDNPQSSNPAPNLNPSHRKRPTSLPIRSQTDDAKRKRRKRDEAKLRAFDPELAARVRLVPITDDPAKTTSKFSVAKSIRARRQLKLPRRRYRIARELFDELVPEAQCEKGRALLYAEAGFTDIDLPGLQGVWRSLDDALLGLVANVDTSNLPKPLRVTLAFDGGSDGLVKSTKFILHLSDSNKPASCFTSSIYAVVLGDESYLNLAPIFDRLNKEIDAIQ